MSAQKKTEQGSEEKLLSAILEKGTKRFSKPAESNRILYGKEHGAKDLLAFARYIDPAFQTAKHFQMIAEKLYLVEMGKIKRLMINMPPGHGKSHLATKIFPVWYLGRNPKAQMIVASYGATLARNFTRWQRNVVESEEYQQIFPHVSMNPAFRSMAEWETLSGGSVIGAGVDGPLTGRRANIAIIDDPIKDYAEAISETMQERVWDWYRSTLLTRLYAKGTVVLIQTRWSTNDLAGKLLETEGEKWEVLRLPAISEAGEPLWPEEFTIEDYLERKRTLGIKQFGAIYQQEPVDIQEKLFTEPKLEECPEGIKLYAYLDPALGGSDYSALTVGGVETKNGITKIFIRAAGLWRVQLDEMYSKVEQMCRMHKVSVLYVESNQAQKAIALEFTKRSLGVKEVHNTQNKYLRIMNAVKLNWDKIRFGAGVPGDYMKQILNYTELSAHDDAPDSLAGLIEAIHISKDEKFRNRYNFSSIFKFGRRL